MQTCTVPPDEGAPVWGSDPCPVIPRSRLPRALQRERPVHQGALPLLQRVEGHRVRRAQQPVHRHPLRGPRGLHHGLLHVQHRLQGRPLRGRWAPPRPGRRRPPVRPVRKTRVTFRRPPVVRARKRFPLNLVPERSVPLRGGAPNRLRLPWKRRGQLKLDSPSAVDKNHFPSLESFIFRVYLNFTAGKQARRSRLLFTGHWSRSVTVIPYCKANLWRGRF